MSIQQCGTFMKIKRTSSADFRGFLLTAQGQRATPLCEIALRIRPLFLGERICAGWETQHTFEHSAYITEDL